MKKLQPSTWYLASIHFLRGGVFAPIIVNFVIGFLILFPIGLSNKELMSTLMIIVGIPSSILGVWIGSIYSAKYINKMYIVHDAENLVLYATIYMAVISIVFHAVNLIRGASKFIFMEEVTTVIRFVGMLIVFYIISKKYIYNTTVEESAVYSE